LKNRTRDIELLCREQIRQMNRKLHRNVDGFTNEAMEMLTSYQWPGNVRELKNLVESLFVTCSSDRIGIGDLPSRYRPVEPVKDEEERLREALTATNWNKSKAAERLHWSRMTLYRKLTRYGIATPGDASQSGDPDTD
jgi:DNA-binding NtrC family response regulator